MVKRHTPFIHKNFLNVFLKNPQPGDSVRDVGAVALDVDKIEGQRYAFVRWIGYTEDSELTDDELTNIETKSPEWCSFLDLNIMVKAIEE